MNLDRTAYWVINLRQQTARLINDICWRNNLPGIWKAIRDTLSFVLDREGLTLKRVTAANYTQGLNATKPSDVTKRHNEHIQALVIHSIAALVGLAVLLVIWLVGVSGEPWLQQAFVGFMVWVGFGIYGTARLDPTTTTPEEYVDEVTDDRHRRLVMILERVFVREAKEADKTLAAIGKRPAVIPPFDITETVIGWQAKVQLPFARSFTTLNKEEPSKQIASGLKVSQPRIIITGADGNDNEAEITVLDVPFGEREIGHWPALRQPTTNIFDPMLWGEDIMGNPVHMNVAPFNWLIAGESGSGKSTIMMQLMMWAVAYPHSIHIISDPYESGDFGPMRPNCLIYREGQSKADERAVKDAMGWAVADITRRNRERRKYPHLLQGSNMVNHQIVMQDPSLAPICLWLDEFQVWANEKWFIEYLSEIQRTGRKAGVFAFAGTQDVSKDSGIQPAMVRLFQSAACGRVPGSTSTNLVLGGNAHAQGAQADMLTGAGAFYVRPNKLITGQRPITLVKAWNVNPMFATHMAWARDERDRISKGLGADMGWAAGMTTAQVEDLVDVDEPSLSPVHHLLERWPVDDHGEKAEWITIEVAVEILQFRNDAPAGLDSKTITRWLNSHATSKIESGQKEIGGTNTRVYRFQQVKQAL